MERRRGWRFFTAMQAAVPSPQIILVLSGGHGLGAVQGGVWEAMEQAGLSPHWIIGTSVGAVNGAIIAGNVAGERLPRLKEFWTAASGSEFPWPEPATAGLRRAMSAMHAGRSLLFGREALFWPRLRIADMLGRPSLFDRQPLRQRLPQLIDFDLLNKGDIRFSLNATDVADAAEVIFDSRSRLIGVEHLLASSAFLPDFEPELIDGRWLADGGLASNVSCDALTTDDLGKDVLCILVDLFRPSGQPPRTLESGLELRQDLVFAAQVRRTTALWRSRWEARARGKRFRVLHLAYRQSGDDLALKTHDYSGATIRRRWHAGQEGAARCFAAISAAAEAPEGFTVEPAALGA